MLVNEMITANSLEKGIVITDHNYKNVIKISSQIILIKEGKTHYVRNNAELVEKGYLVDLGSL